MRTAEDIMDIVNSLGRELTALTTTQKVTSKNLDKLSNNVQNIVDAMQYHSFRTENIAKLLSDVEKCKNDISKLKSADDIYSYRSARLEKVVYGAVGIILSVVMSSMTYLVVSHAK